MKKLMSLSILVLLSATILAQTPELPPPFPRANATKLLENDRINIWDIVWPKGQPTVLHRHIYDQVGTYYAQGGRIITTPDGQKRTSVTEVGSLSTTRKGTTHIEEGNTDPPLRAVFIELKKDGPSGMAPADAPVALPHDAKKLLDDDRVIAWDYTWTAGPQSLQFRAARETVIVFLGEGSLRVSGRDAAGTIAVKAGMMRHIDRGAAETLAIAAGSPRALFFELK
jgi:hypothetical protein